MQSGISDKFEGYFEGVVNELDSKGNTTDKELVHYCFRYNTDSCQEATFALINNLLLSLHAMKRDGVK